MLELYRFRYFDPLRQRWVQARYRASLEEIATRYDRFEITGAPWTPPDLGGTAGDLAPMRDRT